GGLLVTRANARDGLRECLADGRLTLEARLARRDEARRVISSEGGAVRIAIDRAGHGVRAGLDRREETRAHVRVETGRAVRVDLTRVPDGLVVLALTRRGAARLTRLLGVGIELPGGPLLVAGLDARDGLREVLRHRVLAQKHLLVRRYESRIPVPAPPLRAGPL